MDERVQRIQRILDCSEVLIQKTNPGRDRAWLNVDLTMPQLKTLICVRKKNGATSGQIASTLGVALSTITGIVDRLAEQNLVRRHEDPRDRRITRVLPTAQGQQLVDDLLQFRNEMITAILSRLTSDQLQTVETAFVYLTAAIDSIANENKTEEAVA
jgi:DNA-binding MarR family transcriptional regulator